MINQIQLTEEQKQEEITKALVAANPQAPSNVTFFNYKERQFVKEELVDQLVIHFSMDGDLILKDSDEATDQEDYWSQKKDEQQKMLDEVNAGIQDEKYAQYRLEDPEGSQKQERLTSLRNIFNFQARGCQTSNAPLRERGVKTNPPQCSKFSRETTQWQIFDAYMEQYKKDKEEDARDNQRGRSKEVKQQQTVKEDPLYSTSMKRCLKIMERMIV